MSNSRIITENQLDQWVRGNAEEAKGVIVELVYRLVAVSSPNPKERRFPLSDSIGQTGPDGVLHTDYSFKHFVPEDRSYWEIGTGINARNKATKDYRKLTLSTSEEIRIESTFVFVTPLSGRRDWEYSAQAKWIQKRKDRNEWRDVRVIDGTGLIDWLISFPAVELWLANKMGLPVKQIQTIEQHWDELRTIGEPPPLIPQVFLANRDEACEKLKDVFSGTTQQLKLDTYYPDQVPDFVAAYVAIMEQNSKVEVEGSCFVLEGIDAWNTITALSERHIIICNFDIDNTESSGTRLLEKAKRARHAVIFGGMPGGIPHPNRASIQNPNIYQVQEALEKAGYKEERARILAKNSDGNLSSLLRCLQNLSLTPEWSQETDAAELKIAELLGAWTEQSDADKLVVEKLSGKPYGEWIRKMRDIALRPVTPLTQRDGAWKFVARYEGWFALGPRLFDEHLDLMKETAVNVLCERDPQFELSPDERYAANIHGKVFIHSHRLRKGLAESLALLGSYPTALTSCSLGKAESTAILVVREVFKKADWILWASLNDLLPLLAEAAPGEFLDSVENALNSDPCPFDKVYAQEGSGIFGRNYMTGLLWALETLAWDSEYLTRVIVILGELSTRDPGGNWANRPANSLSTILLPWMPQTCAPVAKRKIAVATLLKEFPEVAWKLLLNLLPSYHQVSWGSHKPLWREMITEEWSKGVTQREYWDQIIAYSEIAIGEIQRDNSRLVELIDHFGDLPPSARDQFLAYLRSDKVVSLPQTDRLRLWNELMDFISKHRKYAEANWAMQPDVINEISEVAKSLVPTEPFFFHQRLFIERDFDLYEEKGNYQEQRKALDERRQKAVAEVFNAGGLESILKFANSVESPWQVGIAFGEVEAEKVVEKILPELLESENKSHAQFTGGFVLGMFWKHKWKWIDEIDTISWTQSQKGQLLAYLPFTSETWERSSRLLADDESSYWSKTTANPYEIEKGFEMAIDRLVKYNRPHAAIRCLERMRHDNQNLDNKQMVRVLKAVLHSTEDAHAMDVHAIVEVIKSLQEDPGTNSDDLFQIEWAFLPFLDGHHGASPELLDQKLADDPAFFCEVIRTVFRSKKEKHFTKEITEEQKKIASNAYRLLSNWKIPPGSQKDGMYNGDFFTEWLKNVKATCNESGHLEIALSMVGQVLIYTPPDPDGLWLHQSSATELNARDVRAMRDGFRTALFNSRGVYPGTSGQAEKELATNYREKADKIEEGGYHRLAKTLRELADSYDFDAKQEAKRDPFED